MEDQFLPEDLFQAPSYPDIKDVAPDTVEGSEGVPAPAVAVPQPVSPAPAPVAPTDTIPQPDAAPVAAEQGTAAPPATTPATTPSAPVQPIPQAPQQVPEVGTHEAQHGTSSSSQFTSFGPLAGPRRDQIEQAPLGPPTPPDSPDRITVEGLNIRYAGRDDVPYSRSATANARPFRGIVFHHSGIADSATAVAYQNNGDSQRGGHFGYHFYIDADGSVTQGAPLSRRTNHVKDVGAAQRRPGIDLTNADSIGIAISGSSDNPTPAQIESAKRLVAALQSRFNIPASAAVGHGEVQTDRQAGEGQTLARLIRGDSTFSAPTTRLERVAIGGEGWDEWRRRVGMIESSGRANAVNGNAVGLYQFKPDTWNGLANSEAGRAAGLRALGGGTDPRLDAAQQDIALRLLTEENAKALRARNIEATPGNLYMTHFLGGPQGTRFLSLMRDNPNLPAATIFKDQAEANRRVFFTENGRPRTLQEVYDLQAGKVIDGTGRPGPMAGQRRVTDPLGPMDMNRPPDVQMGQNYRDADLAAIRAARGEQQRGFFQMLGSAFRRETPEGALLSRGPAFSVDPTFTGPVLQEYLKRMPAGYESRMEQAVSKPHAEWIIQKATQDAAIDRAFQDGGWTATGASVAASFLSPSTWAIGLASGGLGTVAANAARFGRTGMIASQAAAGALGNVAYEGLVTNAQGDEYGGSEMLGAALTGAMFGAIFGPLGQNPATAGEAFALRQGIRRTEGELIGTTDPARIPGLASAGAAVNEATSYPEATIQPGWRALQDEQVPRGSGNAVADNARISMGGTLATSPNVGTRVVTGGLLVDVVGKGEHVNRHTVDQNLVMLNQRFQSEYLAVTDPAYREWAKEQGINPFLRMAGWRREEFMQTVGRAILAGTDDEIAALHPAMQRVIAMHGKWVVQRLEEMQDPSLVFGPRTFRRGLPGAENVAPDPRYMPVQWLAHKMDDAVNRVGYERLERFVAGAIKNVQTNIEDDMARRLAKAIITGPRNRQGGIDDGLSRAMAAGDIEKLKNILREEHEWADDTLDNLVKQLSRGQENPGVPLKRRIGMDYRAALELPDGTTLRMTDLLETNAEALMMRYARGHAGRMALANYKAVNPETGDILFDGITSDADWAALILQAERKNRDQPGVDMERWRREKDLLNFAYDRILNKPHPAQEAMGQVADWLRFIRTFNFSRVMNLMGLTSLADVGRSVGSVGIKAFLNNMQAYRRIMTMDGRMILKHGLDRELEAMFGLGTDALRGFKNQVLMDEYVHAGSDRLVDKANRVADMAAHITTKFSAQHAVQSWLELTVGRAAAQRFADIASKGNLSRAERNLVNFLGLDEAMLQRVLGQVRENFSHETGALFGRRVAQMNMDKWTDIEARAAFQQALFRFVRTTVQQNDIGSMHRVMSHPMAQVLLQFRSFSIVAHENQLLQGIAMADERQLGMALGTMLSGSLVYAVQTHLQAIGRSDADSFLEEKGFKLRNDGDFGKLAAATFQRAGFSGLVPMAVDSALMFTPVKPVFNARSTGNPSDIIFGNPTTSLLQSAAGSSRSILGAFMDGRELSQPELRQAFSMLTWQNALGISNTLSYLISGRSEQRP